MAPLKKTQKHLIGLLTLIVAILSVWLVPANHAHAQEVSFTIPTQEIVAEILPNGNVKFTDIQTYDIDFMNGALFTLDYDGYELENYRIGVRDESGEITYFEENNSASQGTYSANNRESIGWIDFRVYNRARNETVDFVYEYEIAALVTNYADTADLNRRFGTNDYTTDVTVKIVLPESVENPDDFRAWGYGAPQGEVELSEEDGKSVVIATVPQRTSSQFVEVQTIFPLAMTPNNPNVVDEPMKEEIISSSEAQVQRDLEQYQAQQGKNRLFLIGGMVFPILISLYATWYYITKRKQLNPNPVKLPKHIYELPEDITPALMATAYYRSTPTTDDFSATIMDLARKGYLTLEELPKEKRGLLGFGGNKSTVLVKRKPNAASVDELLYHEKRALDYILPDGLDEITLEELESKTKKSTAFQKKQYSKWSQFVQDARIQGPLISEQPSSTRLNSRVLAIFSFVAPTLVIALMLYLIFAVEVLEWAVLSQMETLLLIYLGLAVVSLVWGIVLLVLTTSRPIRSAREDEQRQMWDGFKNMLDDIGNFNMREIASLPLWEAYLVYAISLGVADKVTEAMSIEFSQAELETGHLGGGFYSNPYIVTSMMRNSVHSSVASATPSSSGSSSGSNTGGFGGGFSGGSSGGSGGGTSSGGF